MAGETRRRVASDIGVGASTVKRWVASANKPVTDVDELLAVDAGDIAERIKERQAEVRERVLQRIAARIPKTDSLKDLAIAYCIVTDKALLAAGKPTASTKSDLRCLTTQARMNWRPWPMNSSAGAWRFHPSN